MKTIKERTRAWLKRQGRTQDWLAEQLGISTSHLSMILSGQRTPSLPVAKRLEDITGIAATDFAQALAS